MVLLLLLLFGYTFCMLLLLFRLLFTMHILSLYFVIYSIYIDRYSLIVVVVVGFLIYYIEL